MNDPNNLKLHLKNKKKGCDYCFDTLCGGKEIRCGSKYKKNYETSGWDKSKDILYCPACKAEIAILEQAIAEIEKQRESSLTAKEILEEFKDRICKVAFTEDRIKNIGIRITAYEVLKEQLNQLKEEQ